MILQKADDLIEEYDNLIGNHKSNNTNRNATFDNATMLLDDMSQRYSDIDGKLTSYLSISKQIYNLSNKTFLSLEYIRLIVYLISHNCITYDN